MLRPIRDRVIVQKVKKTGILIADDDGPAEGIVQAHGPGLRSKSGKIVPMTVKVGDRVTFPQAVGQVIKGKDPDLLVMNEADILAILED